MTLKGWTILAGILGTAVLGCSSKTAEGDTIGGAVSPGSTGGQAGSSGCDFCANDGGANGVGGAGNGAGGIDPNAICGGEAHKAEALPVDMYIMFDQSSSMGDPLPDGTGTWWTAAQAAVTAFVNNPAAAHAGMGVGIQYFALRGTAPASCTAPYSTPEVEIATLPGNSAALAASIAQHAPTSFTPTGPALQGALDHMKAWAPGHPGRAPVVVLVTDGFPTECQPQQIVDVAALAKTAFETEPKVRTFVVGFNLAVGGTNLDQIAKAGGTGKAFLISNGDIGTAFVNNMLSIASTPLQCSFDLPKPSDPTMTVDPTMVDVRYSPASTNLPEQVVKVNNFGDCEVNDGQGWYFDSPNNPQKIMICPATCAKFAAGTIETVSGCKPIPGKVK